MTTPARHTNILDIAPSSTGLAYSLPESLDIDEQASSNPQLGISAEMAGLAGREAVRLFDQLAYNNGVPMLGETGMLPGERRTIPLMQAIGEVSVGDYETALHELAQPLPDLNAARLMPEPPLVEWVEQRLEQLWRLESERLAMHPSTPWERQAYDRRKAWQEIDESPLGRIRFWRRHEGGATMGMAADSIRFLLETHTKHVGRRIAEEVEEFPYTAVAWADRQLTRFEDACDGLFDMLGGGARHVGNLMQKAGVTRGWEWFKHNVGDPLTTGALYVTVMGGALTIGFVKSIPDYIGSVRHLPHYLLNKVRGALHRTADADSGIQTAAKPNRAMPSEAAPLSESDRELATLLEKAHRHQRIASRRVDLPADHALRTPDPELTDRLWVLAAARFGKTGVVTGKEFWTIWDATHAVMEEAMLEGQISGGGNTTTDREISSALKEMYPNVDAAMARSHLSAEVAVADVLHRLGIKGTDEIGRLNVFAVMAAYFREITVDENFQPEGTPADGSQPQPSEQHPSAAPASVIGASQQTPPRQAAAPSPLAPGIESTLIKALSGAQQSSEDIPEAQWSAALSAATVVHGALLEMGFGSMIEQIDHVTNVDIAIATALNTQGFIEKRLSGEEENASYIATYDERTVVAIAAALKAHCFWLMQTSASA